MEPPSEVSSDEDDLNSFLTGLQPMQSLNCAMNIQMRNHLYSTTQLVAQIAHCMGKLNLQLIL